MTFNERLDLEIKKDDFHGAISRALFKCSQLPVCTERTIVEGRLAEAQYFFDLMVDKLQKRLEDL